MLLLHVQLHPNRKHRNQAEAMADGPRNRKQQLQPSASTAAAEPLRKLNLIGRQLLRNLSPISNKSGARKGHLKANSTTCVGAPEEDVLRVAAAPESRGHLSRHSMACCLPLGGSPNRSPATSTNQLVSNEGCVARTQTASREEQGAPSEANLNLEAPNLCWQETSKQTENQPMDNPQQRPSRQSSWSWQTMRASRSSRRVQKANADKMGQLISLLDAEHQRRCQQQEEEAKGGEDAQSVTDTRLEESWRSFVRLDEMSNKHEKDELEQRLSVQQEAIWELLTTEAFYLSRLRVIINLFQATLHKLQQQSILTEIDANLMFSNVGQVYEANRWLWGEHLEPMLARARQTRRPLEPQAMRDAFVQIRNTFGPYYRYCLDHPSCLRYVKHQNRANELFKVYLAWCEGQKECERLRLCDLLAKPMQRLTKYSLLLRAIAKRTDEPEQLESLELMVSHMASFVRSVDLELRRRDELERLELVRQRIESYDMGNLELYGDEAERLLRRYCAQFQLQAPLFHCPHLCHRQLLLDSGGRWWRQTFGQLRFKDQQTGGKLDVVVLLLTDQLLVCKPTSSQPLATAPTASSTQPQTSLGARWLQNERAKSSSHWVLAAPLGVASQRPSRLEPPGGGGQRQFSVASKWTRSRAGSQTGRDPRLFSRSAAANQAREREPAAHLSLSPRAHSLNLAPFADSGGDDQSPPAPATSAASLRWTMDGSGPTQAATTTGSWRRSASQQPSCHNSSLSLAAARELFRLGGTSADSSRSGAALGSWAAGEAAGVQLVAHSAHHFRSHTDPNGAEPAAAGRLRCIRAPYPLDRLAVHLLKDGLLCCQLNDSQTVAASFVLYTSTSPSHSAPSDLQQAPAGSRSDSESQSRPQNQNGQRSSRHLRASLRRSSGNHQPDNQPAAHLMQLIRQAQARLQLAADFHGRQVAPMGAEQLPQATLCELQRLAQWHCGDPLETPPVGPRTDQLEASAQRALLDQHQMMRLNHAHEYHSLRTNNSNKTARPTGSPTSPLSVSQRRRLLSPLAGGRQQQLARGYQLARSTRLQQANNEEPFEDPAARAHMWSLAASRVRAGGASPAHSQLSTSSDSEQLNSALIMNPSTAGSPQSSWSNRSSPHRLQVSSAQARQAQSLSANSTSLADDDSSASASVPRRHSPRRHLSSLRRQNVILSASGEQQPTLTALGADLALAAPTSHSLISLTAPSTHTTERRLLARLHHQTHSTNTGSLRSESQATTMDQLTSAAFDDSHDLFEESHNFAPGGSFDQNLGRPVHNNWGPSGTSLGGGGYHHHNQELRSASVETRPPPPISVTLTLPNNDQSSELDCVGAYGDLSRQAEQQQAPVPPFYLSLPTRRQLGAADVLLSPIHSISVASPSADQPASPLKLKTATVDCQSKARQDFGSQQSCDSSSPPAIAEAEAENGSGIGSERKTAARAASSQSTGSSRSSSPVLSRLRRLFRRLDSRAWRSSLAPEVVAGEPTPLSVPVLNVTTPTSQEAAWTEALEGSRENYRLSSSSSSTSSSSLLDKFGAVSEEKHSSFGRNRLGWLLNRRQAHSRMMKQRMAKSNTKTSRSEPSSMSGSGYNASSYARQGLISDVGCIGQLVRQEQSDQRRRRFQHHHHDQEEGPSGGYLGFHEKLQLHQRNQREEVRRLRRRANRWGHLTAGQAEEGSTSAGARKDRNPSNS